MMYHVHAWIYDDYKAGNGEVWNSRGAVVTEVPGTKVPESDTEYSIFKNRAIKENRYFSKKEDAEQLLNDMGFQENEIEFHIEQKKISDMLVNLDKLIEISEGADCAAGVRDFAERVYYNAPIDFCRMNEDGETLVTKDAIADFLTLDDILNTNIPELIPNVLEEFTGIEIDMSEYEAAEPDEEREM